MNEEERKDLFQQVFAPKQNERILILTDVPHNEIYDNNKWKERREMAEDWFVTFKKMGRNLGFSVEHISFPATGINNKQIPEEIKNLVKKYDLVIAMTEYSATSSLMPLCTQKNITLRCASMPMVERSMEYTSLTADYTKIKRYALRLEKLLEDVVSADITFSTSDHLILDLRNRKPLADLGECIQPGQAINLPSGETCIAPYEAEEGEKKLFGKSKSNGILPVRYDNELVKCIIQENRISKIIGNGKKAEEMKRFFNEKKCRRNIAELGIGCNPNAVVIGNILEDEKVPGLHIAYGMSSHIGGKIDCDMHQDICYPKKAPIEATSLILTYSNGKKTRLIDEKGLRFELLD